MVMCVPLRAEPAEGAPQGKEKAMSAAGTIIREEGEGERLWFTGGGLWTMKATAEETDGAFILVEDRMTEGKMTPLHTHPNQDETLIVLEGEILVYAEGKEHRVGPRRHLEAATLSTGTQANRRLRRPTRGGHRTWIASGRLPSDTPTS